MTTTTTKTKKMGTAMNTEKYETMINTKKQEKQEKQKKKEITTPNPCPGSTRAIDGEGQWLMFVLCWGIQVERS